MVAGVHQHADLAADARAELRGLRGILEIDQHRKALRIAQPVARVLDRGQRARLRGGFGAGDAVGDVADTPAQGLVRPHIQYQIDRVARLDMAEVVLGQVRLDPELLNRDKGHQRLAGCREVADVDAQVGHQPVIGRDDARVLQVQFRLVQCGARGKQLRIFLVARPERFDRLLQIGLGARDLGLTLEAGCRRRLQRSLRNRAGDIRVDALQANFVLRVLDQRGLRGIQRGRGRIDRRTPDLEVLLGERELRLGGGNRQLVACRVDAGEQITLLYRLVAAHVDREDFSRHLRCDRHHEGVDARLRRERGVAVGGHVPGEQEQTERAEDQDPLAHRVHPPRRRRRFRLGGCTAQLRARSPAARAACPAPLPVPVPPAGFLDVRS